MQLKRESGSIFDLLRTGKLTGINQVNDREVTDDRQIDLTVSEAKVLLAVIGMLDIRGYMVMAKGYGDDYENWTELGFHDIDNIDDYTEHQLWFPPEAPEPKLPTTHIR